MPLYYGYGFDWTIILLLPAIILAMYAQFKVSSTFRKYSDTANRCGYTGAEAAARILASSGINDVRIEHVHGNLTDHYDPRAKVLRLSDAVYGSRSLSAIGVAAHEVGHAVQHQCGYIPLSIRNSIAPVASFGSRLSMPLVFLGLLLTSRSGGSFGFLLLEIGIIMFTAVVVFQIITLPVEFNASGLAIELLSENRLLSDDELKPAKKVLNAAALTYVAAVVTSLANLLRILFIANRRRD